MKKLFWKVNLISLILVCLLLAVVCWNLIHTSQVINHFEGIINTLQKDLSTARKEIHGLKSENKVLAEEAAAWICRYREIQNFLGEMEPGIEKLEEFSRCDNCCDIGGKIEKMGPWFVHWLARVVLFKLDFREEVKNGRN
jgi:FtsZ-binding cell division protein ZapB